MNMKRLLINKDFMKNNVAISHVVDKETILEIPDNSIKVFAVRGYTAGHELTDKVICKDKFIVCPQMKSKETLHVDAEDLTIKLVCIDTTADSEYHLQLDGSSSNTLYTIFDSKDDNIKKSLKIEVTFKYRIYDDDDSLEKILAKTGESTLENNFVDSHSQFSEVKEYIMNEIHETVDKAVSESNSLQDVKEHFDASDLKDDLTKTLKEHGIKIIGGLKILQTDMKDEHLSSTVKGDNEAKILAAKQLSEQMKASIMAEIERHRNQEDSKTAIKKQEQANQLGKLQDQRDKDRAQTEIEIDRERYPNIFIKLAYEHPEEFLELVRIIVPNIQGKGGMLPFNTDTRTAIDILLGTSKYPPSQQIQQQSEELVPTPDQELKRENV